MWAGFIRGWSDHNKKQVVVFLLSDRGHALIFYFMTEWMDNLEFNFFMKDYQEKYPESVVLDPPHSIRHLHDRQLMLQEVANLKLVDFYGNFQYFFS